MAHAYNPSTWEAEAGRWHVRGQSKLHSGFQTIREFFFSFSETLFQNINIRSSVFSVEPKSYFSICWPLNDIFKKYK